MLKFLTIIIKLASFFFGLSQDSKQKALNEANKAINKRIAMRQSRRDRIKQLLEEQRRARSGQSGENIVQ